MKNLKGTAALLLAVTVLTSGFSLTAKAEGVGSDTKYNDETCTEVLSDNVRVSSRLLELFFGKDDTKEIKLCPGGDVFGVKIKQNGVTVAESKGIPALKSGDVILSINGVAVNLTELSKEIGFAQPYALIVAHNHPSGMPYPSAADDDLTMKINFMLDLAGVRFYDHIVVAGKNYYSYRVEGRMDKLQAKSSFARFSDYIKNE